jgi:hypothetical protein
MRAQQALKYLDDTTHYANVSHPALVILGNVALGESLYSEAQECFQESLSLVTHMPDIITRLYGCQGLAARGLKKDQQAQDYFYQALKGAVKLEHFFSFIHILPGIALLFADQGKVERAVEFYALACNYGIVANSKWFADIAGHEITQAAEKLPVAIAKTARARGRSLDLWETAKELLLELEEMGWASIDSEINIPTSGKINP